MDAGSEALALTAAPVVNDFADTQPHGPEDAAAGEGRRRRRRGRRDRDEVKLADEATEGAVAPLGDGAALPVPPSADRVGTAGEVGSEATSEVAGEVASEAVEAGGEGRRRRRGRGERRRDDEAVNDGAVEAPAFEGAAPALAASAVAAQTEPSPLAPAEPAPTLAPIEALASADPATVVPAEVAVAETAAPAPAPVVFELPTQSLAELAQGAGLEWVQSDAGKVAQVRAAIDAEPKPVHVPRELPRVVLPDEGPLVLVETRRDLSAMQLPFEQQPSTPA